MAKVFDMIEIHLFGKLKKQVFDKKAEKDGVVTINPQPSLTMAAALEQTGLSADQIYIIFLNNKLVAARSNMVRWLGYQQMGKDPLSWDLDFEISTGDRIGLFGRDMAALVV